MHVDVDVERARQVEDTVDLSARIAVGVRHRADHLRALLEAFGEQYVGARIVDEAFLGKHADLDVDRPRVIPRERADRIKSRQPDAGIDLDMGAHQHGAVLQAFLQGLLGACVNVGLGEGALCRGGLLNGFRDGALLGATAFDDAGLVEMDVGLDEARRDEIAAEVDGRPMGVKRRRDRRNAPVGDADVGERIVVAEWPGILQYQIHSVPIAPSAFRSDPDMPVATRHPGQARPRFRRGRCDRSR